MSIKNKNPFDMFLRQQPVKILLEIKDKTYTSLVAKRVDCTYSHAQAVTSLMEENGLITLELEGRLKRIKLTEKGKKLQSHLESIKKLLEAENGN